MMCETGADVLSIDSHVKISEAREVLQNRTSLMGNVDTALMINGTPDDVKSASDACIEMAGPGSGFILSTSCDTPIEVSELNMHSLVSSSTTHHA